MDNFRNLNRVKIWSYWGCPRLLYCNLLNDASFGLLSVKGTFLGLDDYWKPIARPLAFSLISGLFSFIMYDVLYESLQPILVLFSVTASMLIPYAFLTMKWNREFVNYATRVFF